jgi:acetyl-CoA carboxylase biotin carboxyl carrier protein
VDLLVGDTETNTEDIPAVSQDIRQLQELYDLMQAEGLEALELQDENAHIRLQRARRGGGSHDTGAKRSAGSDAKPTASEAASSGEIPANFQSIPTPLAGVFYRASSPSSAPYVQEGAVVESGQTLCIIEAMKVMNEIKAQSRCRIMKITAENSRPVTAGQTLFHVEPA